MPHAGALGRARPVFYRDELWGFVGNIAHVGEIGGMAPGSFAADGTEVYQEGLRLPPVKIMDRGEYVKDIWRIILTNHRTPKTTWGDYHAMIGSLTVAEARLRELLDRYGAEVLTNAADQLLDYSERFMRAEIQEIPDGVYEAEDCMEDDGVSDRPYLDAAPADHQRTTRSSPTGAPPIRRREGRSTRRSS